MLLYSLFIKIKGVKPATILACNLSNFPSQNVFRNQALHILIRVSQCHILEATCGKWCNHITIRQLISRDSKRRLVTGYTSQYIQFTLRKQPRHSDAAWEKKRGGGTSQNEGMSFYIYLTSTKDCFGKTP